MRAFLIILIILIGCSNPDKQASESELGELPAATSISIIRIEFEISDFETWLKLYMGDQTERTSMGLTTMGIFKDSKIEDHYHAFLSGKDFASLDQYCESKSFHNTFTIPAMKVLTRDLIEVTQLSENEFDQEYRLLISHKVLDYLEWKPIFDSDEQLRTSFDLTTVGVGRSKQDPSIVYVMFAFNDEEQATGYVNSDVLKSRMREAGVVGDLQVTQVTPIEGIEF